ncbi:NXPE family member 3-like [Anomaloglossus baeobatrachus]|uniref:NXPE family member 3-like n=1 Tax=Anomaloglossus baeobatrachus TaxID=238106 RepID=UPI003F4FFE69
MYSRRQETAERQSTNLNGKISRSNNLEMCPLVFGPRGILRSGIHYHGYFSHNGSTETVKCNVLPPGPDVCTYRDSRQSTEQWFCVRPKGLPCSAYEEHAAGDRITIFNTTEQQFLQWSVTDQIISSETLKKLTILPQTPTTDERSICRPGLPILDPSGYYYEDVWQSRVCRNRLFPTPSNVTACLKGKVVYMFGDSTLRQWWEYLVKFVPSLQRVDLHVNYPGPLLATDAENDYLVQWRAHERPLSMTRTRVQELRYIANELDNIGGGDDGLVIVINCMAHFVPFPVRFYLQRIINIRNAVVRLLERRLQTKVIIKSGNTGFLYEHGSDWLSLQLETLMRGVFSVTVIDAWQMTSCHYLHKGIHPQEIIIKNMVDSLLSYICPA